MFCKNCNSEMKDDAKFCPVCGEKCDTPEAETGAEAQQPTQAEEPVIQQVAEQEADVAKPKKSKKKVIGIVAAIVVLLLAGVGVAAHAQISNYVRKTFGSPESYYQYVEKKNRDEGMELFSASYNTMRDSLVADSQNREVNYKIELGQSLKTMLSMASPEFSNLKSVEINSKGKREKNITSGQGTVLVNGENILTFNSYLDQKEQKGYVQIPELSKSYLDLSGTLTQTVEASEAAGMNYFTMMSDLEKYFPETEQIETLLTTYTDLFIDDMDSVKKTSADLEAEGVKTSCMDLQVTCDGAKFYDLVVKTLTSLKGDKTLKGIVEKADADSYTAMQKGIDDLLESLKASKEEITGEDVKAVMDVYVNGSGSIIGRVFNLNMAGKELKITNVEPRNGSEFGSEFSVKYDSIDYIIIKGNGKYKNGKLNGEFKVSSDDSFDPVPGAITNMENLVTIKMEDVDEDAFSDKGVLNGTFTLSSDAFYEDMGISDYELRMKTKGDKKKSKTEVAVICAGDELAKITVTSGEGKAPKVSAPSDSDTVYDCADETAMMTYMSELDLNGLVTSIKDKCGIDLSSYLGMLGTMGTESPYGADTDLEYPTDTNALLTE